MLSIIFLNAGDLSSILVTSSKMLFAMQLTKVVLTWKVARLHILGKACPSCKLQYFVAPCRGSWMGVDISNWVLNILLNMF